MVSLLSVEWEALNEATSKLRAQLATLPSSSRVQQTSGPVAVAASAEFDAAMSTAAFGLDRQLAKVTQLLDDHAAALRAAADRLGSANNDAVVLINAVGSAVDVVAATPSSDQGSAAAGAAATGALK